MIKVKFMETGLFNNVDQARSREGGGGGGSDWRKLSSLINAFKLLGFLSEYYKYSEYLNFFATALYM